MRKVSLIIPVLDGLSVPQFDDPDEALQLTGGTNHANPLASILVIFIDDAANRQAFPGGRLAVAKSDRDGTSMKPLIQGPAP